MPTGQALWGVPFHRAGSTPSGVRGNYPYHYL
jgi:hypothetical protein